MRLYVWTGFCPDYTNGLAFAIASSEAEARSLIKANRGVEPYHWGDLEVHDFDEPIAFSVYGGS